MKLLIRIAKARRLRMLCFLPFTLADIKQAELFLNADAGFESKEFRDTCLKYRVCVNVDFNTRNGDVNNDKLLDELLAARKNNFRQPHNPCTEYLISIGRRQLQTTFSDIAKYMPKKIHAVTDTGILIKLIAFIWGYTFDKLYKL